MSNQPNVFSVVAGAPFFPSFVSALKQGRIIKDFSIENPLALSQIKIYTPTKRAARALEEAIIASSDGAASFLPDIRPLGEMNWDNFFSFFSQPYTEFRQPIDKFERLLILAFLVRSWKENLPKALEKLFSDEEGTSHASTADAIWLARDLCHLMDEMDIQEISWEKVAALPLENVSQWWQVTFEFLKIISCSWPQILEEFGCVNPEAWRNKLLRYQKQLLEFNPPQHPVIAVGFPSSLGAISELLTTIASLPKGAVVLPAIDGALNEEEWQKLGKDKEDLALRGHPQYGMYKFLEALKIKRSSIKLVGSTCAQKEKRARLIWEALRPAPTTDKWHALKPEFLAQACQDFVFIEAATERQEAAAIAVALREAVEMPQATAALITNDRILARRVVAELRRFGIIANDSGGMPLAQTPILVFVRLLLSCVFKEKTPVPFLSLIKNPFLQLGREEKKRAKIIEVFDLFILRGGTGRPIIGYLKEFVRERLEALASSQAPLPEFYACDKEMLQEIGDFASDLDAAFAPLLAIKDKKTTVAEALIATIACCETLGADAEGNVSSLYEHGAKEEFLTLLRSLVAARASLQFWAQEWPFVFDALLAEISVEAAPGGHNRVFIWGWLEARLQTVNTVIIAGLNEGSMPEAAVNGPFLSRTMKSLIQLEPPEYKISAAAYDFTQALLLDKVILSRARQVEGQPKVPSRWLQRLLALCGEENFTKIREEGDVYLQWARLLDSGRQQKPALRPNPRPPLALRPRAFSVTEIEWLIKDPYSIYAKKILKLRKLEPLMRDYDTRERGELYHKIVAEFSERCENFNGEKAENFLHHFTQQKFSQLRLPEDVALLWEVQFAALAKKYLQWEGALPPRQRFIEVLSDKVEIGKTGVFLKGRADRIDIINPQLAVIIDFKTTRKDLAAPAKKLLVPQLPLEGALMLRGGFREAIPCWDEKEGSIENLLYVHLSLQVDPIEKPLITKQDQAGANSLCEKAFQKLENLIKTYQNPDYGYLSYKRKDVGYTLYDQLARVQEWRNLEEQKGGEGG